jgi:hypothetical protein
MSCSLATTNFDAVALLRYGRFDESMFMLRVALSTITDTPSTRLEEATEIRPSIMSLPIDASCDKPTYSPDSTFSDLFARAFVFEGTATLPNTDRNAALSAAVCLYNMALNFQVKGLKNGDMQLITKATGLYEKVFSILSSYDPDCRDTTSSLLLATVLNLIASKNELYGEVPTTKQWKTVYNNLYGCLMYGSSRPVILESPEEMAFFTTSAVVFDNERHICAAAA